MELAVDYERPIGRAWRWQVYAALAGEPALGPPPAAHRASGTFSPVGPAVPHGLDGPHSSFGVLTAALHNRRWKMETSIFNGREPDELRTDLDLGALESVAARVSWLPTERLAVQASAGRWFDARTAFLDPAPEPAITMSASAIYHRVRGADGLWATTVAVGAQRARDAIAGGVVSQRTWAVLVESSVTDAEQHTVYGRVEAFSLPAHHLHAAEFGAAVFTCGKAQVGYVRHLAPRLGVVPGLGASVTMSVVPAALAPRYGGRVVPGVGVFLRVRPARHAM